MTRKDFREMMAQETVIDLTNTPNVKRPPALADRVLGELEALSQRSEHRFAPVPQELLSELLRVYRLAIERDRSDDVGPFDFFFE
jgi:hypothetical protein